MEGDLHQTIATIVREIHAADTAQTLFSALNAGCESLGFDAFMLSSHRSSKAELVMDPLFTTYPQEFRDDYEQLNWLDDDMLVARTIGSSRPFTWDGAWERYSDVRSQSFLEFLHANRLEAGIMVPLPHKLGHASFMSFDSYHSKTLDPALVKAARIAADAGQAKAEMLGLCPPISADEAIGMRMLSDRQLEILKWIAEGKSDSNIAVIMNLRNRAVRYHVTHILRKLSVATRVQAAQVFSAYVDHQFP